MRYIKYNSVKKITLDELDIRDVGVTGVGLSMDGSKVICCYQLMDRSTYTLKDEAVYIVSDYPAEIVLRHNENGTICYGYTLPGPHVAYGHMQFPAGDIAVPASLIGRNYWVGNGFKIYEPIDCI